MSLYDILRDDAVNIFGDTDGFTAPILLTSPDEEVDGIPPGTVFGTLDPDDIDNQIRAFIGDHYTQYDPDSGAPQADLNAKATAALKTLFDKGVIKDVSAPKFEGWQISWLDVTDQATQRDFLINRIHPTRSLTHVVFILGELEITVQV